MIRAVACAADMQIALQAFNAEHGDEPDLTMGIGVNTGAVIVGNIGSEQHMKYGVVGDAVNLTARVESFTVGGEVLVSAATHGVVAGHVEVRGPIEVRAKGKKAPLQVYSLLAVGPPWDLHVPVPDLGGTTEPVSIPTACYRVRGKEVAADALAATLVRLGKDDAELLSSEALAVYDNIKLTLQPDGGPTLDDLYAKVTRTGAAEQGRHLHGLRFTSVPDPEGLAALLPAAPIKPAG